MESTEIIVPPKRELIKPGCYLDITNDQYHSGPGISKTKLDMFNFDEDSIEWAKNCPVDTEKLKTLDFGDAMHAISLEPERLKADFAVLPKLNLRTNAGKEEKRVFEIENADKKIITDEDYIKLQLMFESLMAHPSARALLEKPGLSESSYYWNDPSTNVLCKCRPDRNLTGTSTLVDIKTTDLLSKFQYSIDDYRYYVQAPFYIDGVTSCGEEKDTFIFIIIQKTIELGRYPVRCETLPRDVIEYGREEYKKNLYDYSRALDKGFFTGVYESTISYNLSKKINGY